ncbi:hypothetical protein BU16DRAFT_565196 [Lophium mytilinum]|uniref:Uncharacterized protein n=1 Tax=Lophium mytilinum TaxID=390894 RepID=A0A6A6QHE1_9PEZI|nr:hypothetical protein BU16DRAFT_565196 [Lophium mytilinum]
MKYLILPLLVVLSTATIASPVAQSNFHTPDQLWPPFKKPTTSLSSRYPYPTDDSNRPNGDSVDNGNGNGDGNNFSINVDNYSNSVATCPSSPADGASGRCRSYKDCNFCFYKDRCCFTPKPPPGGNTVPLPIVQPNQPNPPPEDLGYCLCGGEGIEDQCS